MVATASAFSLACGSARQPGFLFPDGYRHSIYPFGVLVTPPGAQLLPPDWRLDNYYRDGTEFKAKRDPEYFPKHPVDLDGDAEGDVDGEERVFRFDLLFVNERTTSYLYVRTVPLNVGEARMDLPHLAQHYASAVASGAYPIAAYERDRMQRPLDSPFQRRFDASVIEALVPVELAGVPAVDATIALVTPNRDPAGPGLLVARVRVVLCRPPGFTYWRRLWTRTQQPVLLVAGYEAAPQDFEAGLVDYQRLLNAVTIRNARGYVRPPFGDGSARPRL
jgi:hypothetical protein